jgi:hypothetical protein
MFTLIRKEMKTQVYVFPDALKNASNNSLDITKIRFSDTPYKKLCQEATIELKKETFTHFIDMYYKNNPIIIQLPKYNIKNIDNNKMVISVDETLYQYLINPLEEHIIQIVHEQSEKWFNGKKFTMNKIMNSIVSPFNKKESDSTLKLSLNKNTMYFNRYKTLIQLEDISTNSDIEIICLVRISNIQFLQNKFSYNIILEQAKVFMEERLIEYSIIDNTDDKITESVSEGTDNICDGEYFQESIDASKIDFF